MFLKRVPPAAPEEKKKKKNKQAGVLSIRAYQVLPISPTSLALVWVEECDSWKGGLICKWLSTGTYVRR